MEKGIYRYVASKHSLNLLKAGNFTDEMDEASLKQHFVGNSAVTFIWSVIPYRTEWRYNLHSYKVILIDAGHVCQNLYIACEALGLGTCAIGAYNQDKIDKLLNLDGENEFVVYLAPVGRYNERGNQK
jgi:SagB-type dehydrogenase family enzyme